MLWLEPRQHRPRLQPHVEVAHRVQAVTPKWRHSTKLYQRARLHGLPGPAFDGLQGQLLAPWCSPTTAEVLPGLHHPLLLVPLSSTPAPVVVLSFAAVLFLGKQRRGPLACPPLVGSQASHHVRTIACERAVEGVGVVSRLLVASEVETSFLVQLAVPLTKLL